MSILLIILVVFLLLGAFPVYNNNPQYGYGMGGAGGGLLLLLLVLWLLHVI